MNLTPRQLRIVISLAESRSFSRTAEEFSVTQPALSRIVKGIEEEIGAPLFLRTTRLVVLTREGGSLVQVARRVVENYDDGLRAMQGIVQRQASRLSVAALPSLAAMLLPAVAQAVREADPAAQLHIRDVLSDATLDLMLAGDVDFALTSADPSRTDIVYDEFVRDRYVLLARNDDRRLENGAPADLLDCQALGLLSMPKGTAARLYADAAFLQRGAQFRPLMEFEHLATIGKFVAAGFGVGFLPCLAAMMITEPELHIIDLDDAPARSLGVVRHKAHRPSAIAELAINRVKLEAGRLAAHSPSRIHA